MSDKKELRVLIQGMTDSNIVNNKSFTLIEVVQALSEQALVLIRTSNH